jgi:hypothetical protein
MSTLITTTAANLTSLGATSSIGDTYFETTNKKIVVWDGSAWVNYNNDGVAAPFSNSYSISFDGTDDYFGSEPITRLNSAAWTTTIPITVSAWFKITTFEQYDGIFGHCRPNVNGTFNASFIGNYSGLHMGASNGLQLWLSGNAYTLSGTYSTDIWYHGAYTWDGTTVIFYLNGSSIGSNSDNHNGFYTNFGLWAGGVGRYNRFTACKVDELALWDSALSSSDITTLYNGGLAMDVSTLSPLAWYRMGDGTEAASGTTIYDESGNSNSDGHLFNGAAYSTDTV